MFRFQLSVRRRLLMLLSVPAWVFFAQAAWAGTGEMERTNNTLHFGLSGGVAAAGEAFWAARYGPMASVWGGVALGMIPGIFKEAVDQRAGATMKASRHDLKLDLAGAVLGAVLSYHARQSLHQNAGWQVSVLREGQDFRLSLTVSF